MVKSKLDSSVDYVEQKGIDSEDENKEVHAYEIELEDTVVLIAIGSAKYSQVQKDIVFFPMYLLSEDQVVSQIGVVETLDSNLPNVLDADGDLELSKFSYPLLYSFVDKALFEKYAVPESEQTDIEETKSDVKSSKRAFQPSKDDNWVQTFFQDRKFGILDNEGGGDCFFAAIRDGLETIGKRITVQELRNRLSEAATPELYKTYRVLYEQQLAEVAALDARVKAFVEEGKKLKSDASEATNRQEKAAVLLRAKKLRDEIKEVKEEKTQAKELLDEMKWISKLTSFPKFVKAIRTCSFWADNWAATIMERLYNVKLILLSEENYEEGDLNNVLLCGEGDKELLDKKLFRPTEYIILIHNGYHYKLVTYDGKGAFTYNELPRDLVRMIREKCMERNSGLYAVIPEFQEGLVMPDEEIEEPSDLQLHGETTVLQFYDDAAVKPKPGKGTGESMADGADKLSGLVGDWRRKLAHGLVKPFKVDGHMWATVDHYVEAQRFKKTAPNFYLQFTMDSGSKLGQDVDMARAAGAKKKHKGEVIVPKGTVIDESFDTEMEQAARLLALEQKFEDEELRNILKATKDAKLMLYRKGKPARVEVELMRLRQKLG
jgi:hypothetical protein